MFDSAISTHFCFLYVGVANFFRTHKFYMYPINTLVMALSIYLASYHAGVEQGIFQGPQSCSSSSLSLVHDKSAEAFIEGYIKHACCPMQRSYMVFHGAINGDLEPYFINRSFCRMGCSFHSFFAVFSIKIFFKIKKVPHDLCISLGGNFFPLFSNTSGDGLVGTFFNLKPA